MIIGIDIGGTNFRIGALDENNNVHNFRKIYIDDVFKSGDILLDIKNIIKEMFCEIKIDAIAIGIPGTLDVSRKTIVQVPNIKGMDNLKVVDYLNKEFNVPVFIEKDVNMLINYDLYDNHVDNEGIIIAIYYGTGIGNAIMINKQIHIGKDGSAGEIGHIPVDGSEELCGCGNKGCMEAVAGGKYLAKLREEKYPNTNIADMFVEHKDSKELIKFVDRMAMTLATEINILNPDKIIVGGGIINMKEFPKELFISKLKEHTRKPLPCETLDITFAKDNEQSGVIGSCLYARNKMMK